MSDNTNTPAVDDDNNLIVPDELATLKQRADFMKLSYHPMIGVEKLKEKIAAALAGNPPPADDTPPVIAPVQPAPDAPVIAAKETDVQLRVRMKKECTVLTRCIVTCMNPDKKEWEGEMFSVGNGVVATVKKFIPFNVEFHIPKLILTVIQGRECQILILVKDANGNKRRVAKQIKEFSINILPDLTEKELKELAQRQAMAAGTAE